MRIWLNRVDRAQEKRKGFGCAVAASTQARARSDKAADNLTTSPSLPSPKQSASYVSIGIAYAIATACYRCLLRPRSTGEPCMPSQPVPKPHARLPQGDCCAYPEA